eukprot:Gb_26437 [translate_table: standard]
MKKSCENDNYQSTPVKRERKKKQHPYRGIRHRPGEEVARAYDVEALKIRGKKAKLNFPQKTSHCKNIIDELEKESHQQEEVLDLNTHSTYDQFSSKQRGHHECAFSNVSDELGCIDVARHMMGDHILEDVIIPCSYTREIMENPCKILESPMLDWGSDLLQCAHLEDRSLPAIEGLPFLETKDSLDIWSNDLFQCPKLEYESLSTIEGFPLLETHNFPDILSLDNIGAVY